MSSMLLDAYEQLRADGAGHVAATLTLARRHNLDYETVQRTLRRARDDSTAGTARSAQGTPQPTQRATAPARRGEPRAGGISRPAPSRAAPS